MACGDGESVGHPRKNANEQDEIDDSEEENALANLDEAERAEYEALNAALDQISSCLDALEQQNNTLNAQFQELLESSREARRELREMGIVPGGKE